MQKHGNIRFLWFMLAYSVGLNWRMWEFGGKLTCALPTSQPMRGSLSLHVNLGPLQFNGGMGFGPRAKKSDPQFVKGMAKLEEAARQQVMLSKGLNAAQFQKWRERNPETWKHAVLTEARKRGVK